MKLILLLISSVILNYLATKRSKKIAMSRFKNPYQSLPDIIHDCIYIPKINLYSPDYLLGIILFCTIIKLAVVSGDNVQLNLECLAYSLLLRSATVSVTIIPTCVPKPPRHVDYYSKIFLSTHDLIFSGHTIIFILLGKIIESNNLFFYIIGILIQFLLPILLILARQHYTIDVVISMVVYHFFYYMLKNHELCSKV